MARSKTDKPFKTFMVELSMDEHRAFKARAKGAGLSMHDYAVAMLTSGLHNRKTKADARRHPSKKKTDRP